jgi:hypothetical protein
MKGLAEAGGTSPKRSEGPDSALQAGGRGFKSRTLHLKETLLRRGFPVYPVVLGEDVVPTFRTLGFRGDFTPIMHAKLALLGHLWWHDEGPLGHVEDVIGFTPRRLWVSSANFTDSSRNSLEFGYWTEAPMLVQGAERFLVELMQSSEGPDPDADIIDPDLAPVGFDDVAMAEASAEMRSDETDDNEG